MYGVNIIPQISKGVPTKDNRRPSKDVNKDQSIPVHLGYLFQPNINPMEKNFKEKKPISPNMFKSIAGYSTSEYIMPSCISIPEKMARTTGPNQGLGFNQSTHIHVPNYKQKGLFDKTVSIGKIGWNPNTSYPKISTKSF